MVLVFYFKGMLEKVTMQKKKTGIVRFFFVTERTNLNVAHG